YQMQKAWRGERPQEGRFREFYQCDIDVIDLNEISMTFDAEMPVIVYEILDLLRVGGVSIGINNRKILEGYYRGIGIDDPIGILRIVDKLDKIQASGVHKMLTEVAGLDATVADKCLRIAEIRTPDSSFAAQVRALGVSSPLLEEGLDELAFVMDFARA